MNIIKKMTQSTLVKKILLLFAIILGADFLGSLVQWTIPRLLAMSNAGSTMLSIIVAGCIVMIMYYMIHKWDPDPGFVLSNEEIKGTLIALSLSVLVMTDAFPGVIDRVFFSILIGSTLLCSIVDQKTHNVYRVFSVSTVIVGVLYFATKILLKEFPMDMLTSYVIAIIIYYAFLFLMNKFRVCGLGDVIILAACAFYIPMIAIDSGLFFIEKLLIHFIIANVMLMITNVKNMDWKKMKAKNEIAFVPDIYLALMVLLIIEAYFSDAFMILIPSI